MSTVRLLGLLLSPAELNPHPVASITLLVSELSFVDRAHFLTLLKVTDWACALFDEVGRLSRDGTTLTSV